MIITDRIYGRVEVTDPLIIEQLESAPMQRLKEISQDGATHFIQPVWNANRFEHSFGAWYLSKQFNRPIEEQVACLLHDVPHTAFSHVIDFVMNDYEQEYHDRFLKQVVLGSNIPEICGKHGLDIHKVLQKEDYCLLDNRTPELSFDRWDYFMRDAHMLGILPLESVKLIISSAKLKDNQFYFEDLNVAGQLCLTTLMVCQLGYVSATSHGSWFLLAEALKVALKENIITEEDLFATDKIVWDKLKAAKRQKIDLYLERLNPGREFEYAPKDKAEFYGKNKARYIDPLVLKGDKLHKTSELVVGLAEYIEIFKRKCQYIGVKQKEVKQP
jgi:HD superfamily phosphohydrolase